MAFPPRTSGERPKSLVFRTPDEGSNFYQYPTPLSPIRNIASRGTNQPQTSNDVRNSLQRRFTTNALPSLAPIGEKRQPNGQVDGQSNGYNSNRMSMTEKRARQYEALLAQQRRIQAEMAMIDPETRREVDEAQALQQDINLFTAGGLLDPGTPPGDNLTSHPQMGPPNYTNRFSTSTLASPGFSARQSRSGSQMTSPPSEYANPYFPNQNLPSQSVPNSQRNSDHEESDDDYNFTFTNVRHKAGANPNRNSMPVNSNFSITSFSPNLNPVNGTSFPFGDDEGRKSKRSSAILTASPDSKTFLALHQTDDKFPILVRRGTDTVAAFSGPVTPLEMSEDSGQDYPRTDRSTAARHRQSLPPSAIRNSATFEGISLDSILSDAATVKNTAANRRSMEVKFSGLGGEPKRPGLLVSPQKNGANGNPKVSSSYSTNDIPTLKSINSITHDSKNNSAVQTPSEEIPQPSQNQSANFSKPLPPGPPSNQSQSYFGQEPENPYRAPPNAKQAVPVYTGQNMFQDAIAGAASPQNATSPYANQARYQNGGGFNMDNISNAFGGMNVAGNRSSHQSQWSQSPPYQQGGYAGYQGYGPAGGNRYADGPGYSTQSRRPHRDSSNPIMHARLADLKGEIYGLCKDQHGCRFLQKKLEERTPENIRLIFEETLPHVVELMTDPFGNYLCQKLLEYANDEQRTALVEAASQYMVKIALNQHGTRALQKMIEFVNSPDQIQLVTEALQNEVVQLIQDLNGNHVIQKCLNHLKQQDVQFIVNAVCHHVVTVGTHRHGCCVLQRCVDHASGKQKGQLVGSITQNVFALVQDPFGNYVVQYILDLGEPTFTEPLCQRMVGSVSALARQKFSSNVIEKGLRTASDELRRQLVQEMINSAELQRMLRDSFANYVVQTAMDYADDDQKAALIDEIRPLMPAIRHTPHGRRIGTKIQEYDQMNGNGGLASYNPAANNTIYGLAGDAGVRPHFPQQNLGQHNMGYGGPPAQPPAPQFGGFAGPGASAGNGGYGGPGGPVGNGGFAGPGAPVGNGGYPFSNGNGRFPAWPQMQRGGPAPPHNANPF
ncbi:pumilio-family RNA binding repeat-containing protein 3 [Elsinoe australis]|uniref:Pumilio-family RNA binding repeat-containing protein 3 n=1 Tax=Elsinoe australis TaxID=40998 RepID=A0A4U7ANN6_9PEZI|nr:pumilio-family RNA binding repeat-containing protein 3 [Elsinoe australis]